jgi:uncharacterized membrane protein YecN with MAPEG domain
MNALPITLATAGALGLLYLTLTVRVVRGRWKHRVSLGDGGNAAMQRLIRAHANFGEYVPMLLILMALLEASGASRSVLAGAGIALVVGRIAHAIGIETPKAPNPYRFVGGLVTFGLLLLGSLWALWRALGASG